MQSSEEYRYRKLSPEGVCHAIRQDGASGYTVVKQLTFGDSDVITCSDVTTTSDASRDSSYHELDSLASSFTSSFTSSSSCEK